MFDISFDFETCALCPNAAVMSVGAVAWDRSNPHSPFIKLKGENVIDPSSQYLAHVDLRGMFVDGFAFDKATSDWWSRCSDDARNAVLAPDECGVNCSPIQDVVKGLFDFIEEVKDESHEDVCLWAQGSDFDTAILRNICYKYGLEIPVKYTQFRDHRTFFLEGARIICKASGAAFDPQKAYQLVEPYEGEGSAHDPLFDCQRSIYSTWQMMKHLACLKPQK